MQNIDDFYQRSPKVVGHGMTGQSASYGLALSSIPPIPLCPVIDKTLQGPLPSLVPSVLGEENLVLVMLFQFLEKYYCPNISTLAITTVITRLPGISNNG